ncbi:MAG: DUF3179 domain-containing (seleno)protein [Bacteroidota bacterium]
MKSFHSTYVAISLSCIFSCSTKEGKENDEQPLTPVTNDPNKIELVAQEWPGQKPKPYAMPVHTGLDKLEFGNPSELDLQDQDLVLGMTLNEVQIALPLSYLEGFEVANLILNDQNYLLTWCGLVGSAQVFAGNIGDDTLGFDFGRALINNNLLMVDRKTQSVWNQLSNEAVHGELKGTKLDLLPAIQTTWGFWKKKYPTTNVLINKDTVGAAFPSLLFEKPYYTSWQPDSGNFYMLDHHQPENLGLGLVIGESSLYFPFSELFKYPSPVEFKGLDETLIIHFDASGLTAWAEDSTGNVLPGTLAYNWAWKTFHPESEIFKD